MAKKQSSFKKSVDKVVIIAICVVLVLYTISMLLPLVWGFIMSVKPQDEVTYAMRDLEKNWKILFGATESLFDQDRSLFGNYVRVIEVLQPIQTSDSYFTGMKLDKLMNVTEVDYLWEILMNTVLYTVGGALILAVMPCVMGYMCAKYPNKFSSILVAVALFAMIMPSVGTYPVELVLLRKLGLYNSIWGNWIQACSFAGQYFFVYVAFFSGVDQTYTEAAEIDGASQLRVLIQIIIPLASKMIATVFLIQFINRWNDYQTPLLYLPTNPTLSYALFMRIGVVKSDAINDLPGKCAGCLMLALPIIVLFIAFRDKIMGNVSMGGLKG
ncbi:MAG: carbohydrate ABC transporter permease [Clostridia bacterium]|nr:carbohydrate ABC transporter permease [Clostridia bacterium]